MILNGDIYPNINYFIERAGYFPFDLKIHDIDFELGFFISIDRWINAHNAGKYNAGSSLTKSEETHNYMKDAIDIFEEWGSINVDTSEKNKVFFDNDHEVVDDLYNRISYPPKPCTPLYFISYTDPKKRRATGLYWEN